MDYASAADNAANQTFRNKRAVRSKNTNRTYAGPVVEFENWCRRRCPNDHTNLLIDDKKLHLFLIEEVIS